jgi:dTDP-4-dehydrorhamnose reductase
MNQKVLITGASGYVGAKVYESFQDRGIKVIGTYFSHKLFDELVYCDLTDKDQVKELFDTHKPDIVIHIAANASNGSCEENPEAAKDLNVKATKYLVEESKKLNSKFIFISSLAAYNPRGVYGESKINGEELVSSLNHYMILRPSLIIGLSPNTTNDRPFNRFVQDLESNKKEVEYDSSWEFNVTFLSHLTDLCLNIIESGKYRNLVVPVVSKGITSRYKLAKEILGEFGISVKAIDKKSAIEEPEIDWEICDELNLPKLGYEEGVNEVIKDLKRLNQR